MNTRESLAIDFAIDTGAVGHSATTCERCCQLFDVIERHSKCFLPGGVSRESPQSNHFMSFAA
jgi:hypothetical protein